MNRYLTRLAKLPRPKPNLQLSWTLVLRVSLVYGTAGSVNAWNSWMIGAAVFLLGATRAGRPLYSAGLSWLNVLLGIWIFFSPWILGYFANEGRLVNSLCVGVIVFVVSAVAAISHRHPSVSAIHRT